ncbi:hypothetical protein TNCV_3059901 [Trichonephila clavipes]|nr:hypothetical protein TNCV_3059901 [Trichonephila clavipes]
MATGSYMTPTYSRSQSEVQGDLHNLTPLACSNMAFKYNFKMEDAEMLKDKNWAILNGNLSWVPRKAVVADFRLLTGHDCLKFHLYRIGITDSPDCTRV